MNTLRCTGNCRDHRADSQAYRLGAPADRQRRSMPIDHMRDSRRSAAMDDATACAGRGRSQSADCLDLEIDPVMPATTRVLLRLIGRKQALRWRSSTPSTPESLASGEDEFSSSGVYGSSKCSGASGFTATMPASATGKTIPNPRVGRLACRMSQSPSISARRSL
jgi:hypothetical protein